MTVFEDTAGICHATNFSWLVHVGNWMMWKIPFFQGDFECRYLYDVTLGKIVIDYFLILFFECLVFLQALVKAAQLAFGITSIDGQINIRFPEKADLVSVFNFRCCRLANVLGRRSLAVKPFFG